MAQRKPSRRRPLEKRVVQKPDGRYLILYSRRETPPDNQASAGGGREGRRGPGERRPRKR